MKIVSKALFQSSKTQNLNAHARFSQSNLCILFQYCNFSHMMLKKQYDESGSGQMSISEECLSDLITKIHRLWLSANGTTQKLSTSDKHTPSIVISDRNKSDHYRIHPSFFFWTPKLIFVYDLFLASYEDPWNRIIYTYFFDIGYRYYNYARYLGWFLLLPAVSARPKTISSIWGHIIQERWTLDDVPTIKNFWWHISLNSLKYLSEHFSKK